MSTIGEALPASQLLNGRMAVAVANTAIALSATAVPCRAVAVSAPAGNSAAIYIGGAGVVSSGSTTGVALAPGEKVSIDIDDVSKVYVNGAEADVALWAALAQ